MKILIAGEGVVGFRITEELMASHQIVYLASEAYTGTRLEKLDVETVMGEVTAPESLRRARVGSAEVFVACSDNDEQNIVSCIAA